MTEVYRNIETRAHPLATAQLACDCGAAKSGENPPEDQRPHIAFNDYVNEVLRSKLDLSVQRTLTDSRTVGNPKPGTSRTRYTDTLRAE